MWAARLPAYACVMHKIMRSRKAAQSRSILTSALVESELQCRFQSRLLWTDSQALSPSPELAKKRLGRCGIVNPFSRRPVILAQDLFFIALG